MGMNRTLENAVSMAQSFPEDQQEVLARELVERMEEMRIDARIAEAEARGGELDADVVFNQLRADIESGAIHT